MPPTSLAEFIHRFAQLSLLTDEALIVSVIYIDRALESGMKITRHELHRLVLTACVLSIKYNLDDYYDNAYYAKLGGLSLAEMNGMERDLVRRLDYRLFVGEEEFRRYKNSVLGYVKGPARLGKRC